METKIKICSYSVPWELDNKDLKIIEKNQDKSIPEIVKLLWIAAQK